MAGGQVSDFLGPRQNVFPTLTPDDLILSQWGPPIVEAVTLHSSTFDKSTRATAVRSTGTYLKKGLLIYLISTNRKFAAVSMQNGNSPTSVGSPAFHERAAGILYEDVDMLDENGVVADKPGLMIRVGHINSLMVHDAFGNFPSDLRAQFIPLGDANARGKWNYTNFLFSLNLQSPGFDSPV